MGNGNDYTTKALQGKRNKLAQHLTSLRSYTNKHNTAYRHQDDRKKKRGWRRRASDPLKAKEQGRDP